VTNGPLLNFNGVSRLNEHVPDVTLPAMLEGLENYARYEIGRETIPATGRIHLLGRNADLGKMAANIEVTFFESLDGLEPRIDGQCVAVLKDYRTFKHIAAHWQRGKLPQAFYFEPCIPIIRPRIAVTPLHNQHETVTQPKPALAPSTTLSELEFSRAI